MNPNPFATPDDYFPTPETGVPLDEAGKSVIPELEGRDPNPEERMLLGGYEIPLSSSNVSSVQWRWGTKTGDSVVYDPQLFVRFKDGSLYRYLGVTLEVAHQMVIAPSPGKFVWQNLRDRYPYEKM